MKYKKFKPELDDQQVDDLEKATEETKTESSQSTDDVKERMPHKIQVILTSGERKTFECNLAVTKPKDVSEALFKAELAEGKAVRLLFAGKVLAENNTLEDWGVKNEYWLHAILKQQSQNQNLQPNNNDLAEEMNESKFDLLQFWFQFK